MRSTLRAFPENSTCPLFRDRPGIGHYYRIQGPTFLIEFVNTQSDSAGNPASHNHSFLRDPSGDFAIPAKRS